MDKKQPNLNEMLNSPQAADLLKNKQAVESILHSEEAKRLMELLNQNSGGGLEQAARSAMSGDPSRLMGLVENLMRDPQSAGLVENLNKKVPK